MSGRQSQPADVFRELVVLSGRAPARPLTVSGTVDFTAVRLHRPIRFKSMVFDGTFRADHADFEGELVFENCDFRRGADLQGTRIGGSLKFLNCRMGTPSRKFEEISNTSLRLDHASVEGDLIVQGTVEKGCVLEGTLSARSVGVKGDMRLGGARIAIKRGQTDPLREYQDANTRHLAVDLYAGEIEGDLVIGPIERPPDPRFDGAEQEPAPPVSEFGGTLMADALKLGGRLHIFASRTINIKGPVCLNGASISSAYLDNLAIEGGFEGNALECTSIFRIAGGCRFGTETRRGDLQFGGVRIGLQLDLQSISHAGVISFNGAQCGSFLCGRSFDGVVNCRALDAIDSNFTSYVGLAGLRIKRAADAGTARTQYGSSSTDGKDILTTPAFDGVRFHGCRFEDGLAFWSPSVPVVVNGATQMGITAFGQHCKQTSIEGSLRITDCQIVGDLDLSRLTAKSSDGKGAQDDDGTIAVERTSITGGLRFCSPESFANRRRIAPVARRLAQDLINNREARENWEGATAGSLRLRGTSADEVDLTGLILKAVADSDLTASVDASRITVFGRMKIYETMQGNNDAIYYAAADIPGELDLEMASIGELVISAKSFPGKFPERKQDGGISLQHAKIAHLRIPRLDRKNDGRNGFPVPINLSDVQVGAWSFAMDDIPDKAVGISDAKNNNPGKKTDISDDYLDILDNDLSLHRPIYRSVYRQLRDSGNDYAARRIFVAEHYRAFWESMGSWESGGGRMEEVSGLKQVLGGGSLVVALVFLMWWCAQQNNVKLLSVAIAVVVLTALPRFIGPNVAPRSRRASYVTSGFRWPRRIFYMSFNLLFQSFLRYGISAWRLGYVIMALFVVSFWFVAREPSNFEVTESVREVLARNAASIVLLTRDPANLNPSSAMQELVARNAIARDGLARGYDIVDDGEVLGPDPACWNFWDAVWITARYHIPLVNLFARSEFAATNDRGLQIARSWPSWKHDTSCGQTKMQSVGADNAQPSHASYMTRNFFGLNAEDWFGAMYFLNWILWPVLLTFLLRRALRD